MWQHCVSLSCLCNSLTQIEWVADFSLGDEDSDNIASERYENRHLRRPLSCLMPHISRTPANICITLISLETTFTGLHFRCWQYGSICIRLTVVASQTCEIMRNSERIRPYSSSRSSKVIDLGVNRKPICDFLLVFDILLHKGRKIAFLPYPTLLWGPRLGKPRQNFSMKLTAEKLEGWAAVWWKFRDPSFNRFWLIHQCDRPTDGRTDRQTDRQTELPWYIRAIA